MLKNMLKNKNPTPSAVDLAFAITIKSRPQVVLSEMKFECTSEKQTESLALDIVGKVKGTKDLFSQDIPFLARYMYFWMILSNGCYHVCNENFLENEIQIIKFVC